MTQLFAIIGDPVAQVRSPEVFNALFHKHGVDAVMVPMQVIATEFSAVLAGLKAVRNLAGLVITVPHKPAAAALAERMTNRAAMASAANALKLVDGQWIADLFDGEGFVLGLLARGHEVDGRHCAIVGTGGAGAAIAVALLERPIASLTLWDIDADRCRRLADRLQAGSTVLVAVGRPGLTSDVVVNATPLGMRSDDPLPIDVEELRPDSLVADAVMKPPMTALLEQAQTYGCQVQQGRHMLDAQVDALWRFFELPEFT